MRLPSDYIRSGFGRNSTKSFFDRSLASALSRRPLRCLLSGWLNRFGGGHSRCRVGCRKIAESSFCVLGLSEIPGRNCVPTAHQCVDIFVGVDIIHCTKAAAEFGAGALKSRISCDPLAESPRAERTRARRRSGRCFGETSMIRPDNSLLKFQKGFKSVATESLNDDPVFLGWTCFGEAPSPS
jgi:hypothetical protein